MTMDELSEVISRSVSDSYVLSLEQMSKSLFRGTDHDMTADRVYTKMIMNAVLFSANLSAQVVVANLVHMGIISEERLANLKLKPQMHLVGMEEAELDDIQEDKQGPGCKIVDFKYGIAKESDKKD